MCHFYLNRKKKDKDKETIHGILFLKKIYVPEKLVLAAIFMCFYSMYIMRMFFLCDWCLMKHIFIPLFLEIKIVFFYLVINFILLFSYKNIHCNLLIVGQIWQDKELV